MKKKLVVLVKPTLTASSMLVVLISKAHANSFRPIVIALLFFAASSFLSEGAFGQAVGDYRSFGGGTDWNTAANWERCVIAGAWPGVASANYPGQIAAVAGSTVTIRNGHTRIIDANTPNSIVNLIVGEGTSGTMSIGANAAADGYSLTCSGSVTINNGGTISGAGNDAGDSHTLIFQSTLLNDGTITLGAGTDQVALTVTGPTTNNGSITFGSNTEAKTFIGSVTSSGSWTSTGLTSNLFFRNGVTTTSGTFVAGGATFNTTAGQSIGGSVAMSFANPVSIATDVTLTGSAAITFNGTVTLSGATTDVTNTNANTVSITGTGAAQLTGTAGSTWVQGTNSTFSYSGSTLTNVTLTATASPNTVRYAGGNQTAVVTTYDNLTIAGTNTKTFASSPTVNAILSMEGTASVTVSGAGTVSYGSNATLQYNKSGAYVATSEEWVTPFLATGGVIITNTGAITQNDHKVFGNNTNVPLNINAGATLLTNNNDLTFHGDFINDGTLTAGGSDIVITGTFTPQSIDEFTTTGAVSMTKSSGTATLNGDVNGASLVLNGASGMLDLGSGLTHTFTGDWARTAGTAIGGSSTLNIGGNVVGSGGTFTAGTGTVDYTGAAQTTAGVNYYNLTFSGSGAKTLGAGTTTISGDFTLSGTASTTAVTALTVGGSVTLGTGTTFIGGAFTHNVTGDWSNNGGTFTNTGSTINLNGADQSIGGSSATSFNNLTLSGSGIKTLTTTPAIGGNLTLSGTASTTAIGALTIGGAVTLGSGTTFTAGPYTHNVAGNWTNNGGTFGNAGSTINFNGAAQAIGGTNSTTFNSISLSGSNTKTFNVSTIVADRFTINTGVVANLSTFTTHTTNSLNFGSVGQVAGTWGGTTSAATNIDATFFATATGILTVAVQGSTTYYSRQSGNWNATTTWSTVTYANATNTGTFPVAGDIVNIGGGNFTITVPAGISSACTIISFLGGENFDQSVSLFNATSSLNVSGVINIVEGDGFGDSNVVAVGAGALTAGAIAFSNGGLFPSYALTISTGTATVNGDVTQTGFGSAIVTFSNAGLLRVGGDLANLTFLTPNTGTVEYFGSGDQNISTLVLSSYNNLTLSGTGTKTAGGDTDINGVFTLGSGTSFVGGPYIYTLAGNWINNGTTFTNTNFTLTLNGGAQSIGGTTATTFNNLTLSGGTKAFTLITTINGLLSINAGALANLGSITTHFARSLALAGAGAAPGSWGSTASAATNTNNTYFTAGQTGILNVSNRAYFSRADGNWNANGTWSTVTYDNATNTGTFPGTGDIANIGGDGYTVTVNAVSNCGELNFEGNTGNDNLVNMSSTLNVSGAVNIPNGGFGGFNTIAVATGTLNAGSIVFSTEGLFASGTHSITISTGSVNVSGDVSQSGGSDATITFSGAGTLRLGGAFLNSTNCNFTANTSTVHYQGAVAQTVGDFTYYNLTLNNTSGSVPQLTLYDDAQVSSTLTMTAGILNLNSSTLILGTAISPGNNGTLSYTSGWMYGGTFRRYFNESTAVTLGTVNGLFPLGTSSNYRPLYLGKNTQNNSGGALNVSHDGTNNGSSAVNILDDNGTVVMRSNSFWTVSKATGMNGTGTPYSILAGGTGFGTVQEVDDLRLTQAASEVGTTSLPNSGTTSSPLVQKISISNANLARNYYIGSVDGTNSPLPISLLYFKAGLNGNIVTTTWATAQELNNDYFTVERATNIENFEPVGLLIDGAGTTKIRHDYSMIDENPLYGRSYYRLKQTDFDGKYSYSAVQVVDYEGSSFASLRAYPNPSDGTRLTVLVRGLKEQSAVPIQIYNVQGQMVYESILDVNTPGTLDHEIEFGTPLNAGVYFIKAGPTLQLTQKIFIR